MKQTELGQPSDRECTYHHKWFCRDHFRKRTTDIGIPIVDTMVLANPKPQNQTSSDYHVAVTGSADFLEFLGRRSWG